METLLKEDEIQARVRALAADITEDYRDRDLVVVGVLKGCFIFISDLVRAIDVPHEIDYMSVSSYGNQTSSSGVVRLLKDLDTDVSGRDVLLVEDIVDTGRSLSYLFDNLETRNPDPSGSARSWTSASGGSGTWRSTTSVSRSRTGLSWDTDSTTRNATGSCPTWPFSRRTRPTRERRVRRGGGKHRRRQDTRIAYAGGAIGLARLLRARHRQPLSGRLLRGHVPVELPPTDVLFAERYKAQKRSADRRSFIQDRTIYEDAEVFARTLFQQGDMTRVDYDTYRSLFWEMVDSLAPPALILYLRASVPTLLERIASRGRACELAIAPAYLERLDDAYAAWMSEARDRFDVLEVDTETPDFLTSGLDRIEQEVIRRVRDKGRTVGPEGKAT